MRIITVWITYQRVVEIMKGENPHANYNPPFIGGGRPDASVLWCL